MSQLKARFTTKPLNAKDFIRIHHNKRKIQAGLSVYRYIDKDTKQVVVYIPALEITGYGETKKKAEEMLNFSVGNMFDYLINLSAKDLKAELLSLGWKQDAFRNKEYSKAFVDANGELKNFAVDNKVEKLAMTI